MLNSSVLAPMASASVSDGDRRVARGASGDAETQANVAKEGAHVDPPE